MEKGFAVVVIVLPGVFAIEDDRDQVRPFSALGFELVEVAPLLDPTYVTAYNGAQVIGEAMTGMAMRRLGITDPWYLDPRTSGRDPVPGQRTD